MRPSLYLLLLVLISSVLCDANGKNIQGTWIHKFSDESVSKKTSNLPFVNGYIQILDAKLALSPRCLARLEQKNYSRANARQDFFDRKIRGQDMSLYLKKFFYFNVDNISSSYTVDKVFCAHGIQDLLVEGDQMLAISSDGMFHVFYRKDESVKPTSAIKNIKQRITPLPFDLVNFSNLCYPLIPRIKGIAQKTGKCAPIFYPYVAGERDDNQLAKLVGTHRYIRDDPGYFHDFNNPVSNGLFPIFMVLPPLKDIVLLRVDDSDKNFEDRDIFRGTYLSIKDGAVVDQIDEGCSVNENYVCVDRDGRTIFRLTETGKFERP